MTRCQSRWSVESDEGPVHGIVVPRRCGSIKGSIQEVIRWAQWSPMRHCAPRFSLPLPSRGGAAKPRRVCHFYFSLAQLLWRRRRRPHHNHSTMYNGIERSVHRIRWPLPLGMVTCSVPPLLAKSRTASCPPDAVR